MQFDETMDDVVKGFQQAIQVAMHVLEKDNYTKKIMNEPSYLQPIVDNPRLTYEPHITIQINNNSQIDPLQMHYQQMHSQQMHSQQMYYQQMHSQQMYTQQMHSQQMHTQQMHYQQMYNQQMYNQQMYNQQMHYQQMHTLQMYQQMFDNSNQIQEKVSEKTLQKSKLCWKTICTNVNCNYTHKPGQKQNITKVKKSDNIKKNNI